MHSPSTAAVGTTGNAVQAKRVDKGFLKNPVEGESVDGINVKVKIFGSTDKMSLVDCLQKGEGKGFHMGRIAGTNKLFLFCGHKPDKVGTIINKELETGF